MQEKNNCRPQVKIVNISEDNSHKTQNQMTLSSRFKRDTVCVLLEHQWKSYSSFSRKLVVFPSYMHNVTMFV